MKTNMLKSKSIAAVAALAGVITSVAFAHEPTTSGYADINGLKYYYEVTGTDEPLLLLHGGLGSIDLFEPSRPALSKNHRVIAVDLHGHGRTALGNRDISLIDQGRDMAVLIKSLGFSQVDVIGYSMGGGVAFQFALQNPSMVRRLVLVSTPFAQDGFYPEMLPMQAQTGAAMMPMMKDSPFYKTYVAVAPKPEDFPKLLDEMGAYMRKPYDWSADVPKLTMPVMLVYGDCDMFRPEHIVRFYQLLGGGLRDAGWQREHLSKNRLAILPNVTHYEMSTAPQLLQTVLPFLEDKSTASPESSQPQK